MVLRIPVCSLLEICNPLHYIGQHFCLVDQVVSGTKLQVY